jgi:alkanesulfonate monooxygenase SsuD/methylene tetrahydromethanopterin reductase-like flavin-dependent oxidoreductase (luciferase family)
MIDDESLVRCFEAGQEPAGGFHHAEHVRVAWWYLRRHPWPEALARFGAALRRFAAAQGKPNLFHETITTAFVLVINQRLDDADRQAPWTDFVSQNPDLLTWRPSVLDRYYRPDTLQSERARRSFLLPDRLAD